MLRISITEMISYTLLKLGVDTNLVSPELPLIEWTLNLGVTKHRNGTERNGIYRNKPEYARMRRNEQEWYRNDT